MKTKHPAVRNVVHSEEAVLSAANPPTRAAGDFMPTRSASLLPQAPMLHIAYTVAEEFGLTIMDLRNTTHRRIIAWPRQIAMFLGYESGRTHHVVGQWWDKNHGTSIHACRIVRDRMDVYPEVRDLVHRLATTLGITIS